MSVKVRQFMLQKVIVPFAKESREGDPNYNNIAINDATCDGMQSVLCLDSDMPFLTLLKREEIAKQTGGIYNPR